MTEIERIKTAFKVTGADQAEGHLSEQQWESLGCGELNRPDYEAVLDHILGCPRCTEIHQSLLVVREHAHAFDPGAPAPELARKPSKRGWVFSSMLAVAATLLLVIFRPFGPGLTDPGPSTSSDLLLRSSHKEQTAAPLSPIGPVLASAVAFSWEPSHTAPVSIVQLIDGSGEVVWTSQETEKASVEWPSNVAKRPGHYYWRVLSVGGATGGEQASDLVAFDLTENLP